jgi:pilus assembly protein CpaB
MNRRLILIFVAALLIALLCTVFIAKKMQPGGNARKQVTTTRIVAASGDVKVGAVLVASNIKTVEMAGALPKGALLKPEQAVGRAALVPLYDGAPILDGQLAAAGSGGGLAPLIPQGMRACAVKVDEVVGVAGFATPGMRVDVLASGVPSNSGNPNAGAVTQTILQNIQVLSAGTDYQKDAEGKAKPVQVVNLLVTPEQAQALTLATTQTVKIQLVLRNPLDTKVEPVKGTGMSTLFGGGAVERPRSGRPVNAKPAAKPFAVEIINGSKKSEQLFSTPGVRP